MHYGIGYRISFLAWCCFDVLYYWLYIVLKLLYELWRTVNGVERKKTLSAARGEEGQVLMAPPKHIHRGLKKH